MYNLVPVRVLLAQKTIGLGLLLPLLWWLTPKQFFFLYAVSGQAHFALTYWYQYRNGKLAFKLRPIALYLATLGGCFYLAYMHQPYFVMATATFFMIHFMLDEFKINTERLTLPLFLAGTPLLAFFVIALYHHQFSVTLPSKIAGIGLYFQPLNAYMGWAMPTLWGLAGITVLGYGVLSWINRRLNVYGALMLVLGLAMMWEFPDLPIIYVRYMFGIVILLHYFNWYVGVFVKLRNVNPGGLKTYMSEIVIANVISAALFFSMYFSTSALYVGHFGIFGEQAFLAWTMMHLLTTVRAADYRSLAAVVWPRRESAAL